MGEIPAHAHGPDPSTASTAGCEAYAGSAHPTLRAVAYFGSISPRPPAPPAPKAAMSLEAPLSKVKEVGATAESKVSLVVWQRLNDTDICGGEREYALVMLS